MRRTFEVSINYTIKKNGTYINRSKTLKRVVATSARQAAEIFMEKKFKVNKVDVCPGRMEQPYTQNDVLYTVYSFAVLGFGQRVYTKTAS